MTTNNTLLTVNSPFFSSAVKKYFASGVTAYSLQDFVDRINQSPILVQALNDIQQQDDIDSKITVDPNSDRLEYRSDNRSLIINGSSFKDPIYFARNIAHEIAGHDQTRDIIASVLDPNHSLYQSKSPAEVKRLVTEGCFMTENIAYITEYRVGQQAGFSATQHPFKEQMIKDLISKITAQNPGATTKVIDLAAAKFLATTYPGEISDTAHIGQCIDWANHVVNATPNNVAPAISHSYDTDTGQSIVTVSQTNGAGVVTQIETFQLNADSTTANNIKNLNTAGAVQNETITNTSATGQKTVTYSGHGGVIDLSNSALTLAAGSQVTVNGAGNKYFGGAGATLNTTQADGTQLTIRSTADGGSTIMNAVNHANGFDQQITLMGNNFNTQAKVWLAPDGARMFDLSSADGKGLNNGQDSLITYGYSPGTNRQFIVLRRQTNGVNLLSQLNADNTTTVQAYNYNADGSFNWTPLFSRVTLSGNADNVRANVWATPDGARLLDLSSTDGKGLNNGQDSLITYGYAVGTNRKYVEMRRQTDGINVQMQLNADNTTTVQVYRYNPDGSFNWTPLFPSQIFSGADASVRANVWATPTGERIIDLSSADGKGLNNGQDTVITYAYAAGTNRQYAGMRRQTDGVNVMMQLNPDNTTTVQVFRYNPDGSFNWTPLFPTKTLSGGTGNIRANITTTQDGVRMLDLTSTDGKPINNGKDTAITYAYRPGTNTQYFAFHRQADGANVMTRTHADNSQTVEQYRNNADGSVNWTILSKVDTFVDGQGRLHTKLTQQDGKYFETVQASADPHSKVDSQIWIDSQNQLHKRKYNAKGGFVEGFRDSRLGSVELIQTVPGNTVVLATVNGNAYLPPEAAGVDFNFGSVKHSDIKGQPWAFTHPPSIGPWVYHGRTDGRNWSVTISPMTEISREPPSLRSSASPRLQSSAKQTATVPPEIAPSPSVNNLIQSMAAFTDGGNGIDPTFSTASANAANFRIAVNSAQQA